MTLKERLKRLLGPRFMAQYNTARLRRQVPQLFRSDYRAYQSHSAYCHPDTPAAWELELTVLYHSLEKGFLHRDADFRPCFGRAKVSRLLEVLDRWHVAGYPDTSQVISAEEILSAYYRHHSEQGIDIEDYFPRAAYDRLRHHGDEQVLLLSRARLDEGRRGDFASFAHSRHSFRSFTDHPVTPEELRPAIDLANTAPSACNRQEVRVRLISDAAKVEQILDLQGGFTSERQGIHQLLLVTASIAYTYTEGTDRHQPYIDGGIYLMNLLYALHYYGIGSCVGNVSLIPRDEETILRLGRCCPDERLIAIVPLGHLPEEAVATRSRKRPAAETFITD